MHKVLVRGLSLPRKNVIRFTDFHCQRMKTLTKLHSCEVWSGCVLTVVILKMCFEYKLIISCPLQVSQLFKRLAGGEYVAFNNSV